MCGTVYEREQGRGCLALCEGNEHERAVGSGMGEDQGTSVLVFHVTASGPLWTRTQRGGHGLRDALQVAATRVNRQLTSAREAPALTR